jgi:sec-independent protein translocase protein TatA
MFGLSGEHVVILFIILLIFGPRKLPELGNTLGKALKNFKDSVSGVQEPKYRNLDDDADSAKVVSETKTGKKTETKVGATKTPSDDDSKKS